PLSQGDLRAYGVSSNYIIAFGLKDHLPYLLVRMTGLGALGFPERSGYGTMPMAVADSAAKLHRLPQSRSICPSSYTWVGPFLLENITKIASSADSKLGLLRLSFSLAV
ncbi:hypothetical protein J6590_104974, partial [Homalodisca vitripennis]